MKCSIPRCEHPPAPPARKRKWHLIAPQLDLCEAHGLRYAKEFNRHFEPLVSKLSRRWKVQPKIAQERMDAVLQELAASGTLRSWQSTWIQMVDDEILNSLKEPSEPPKSSQPVSPPLVLPEHATREGQAAIAKRKVEEDELEHKLKGDIAEFMKGQRQVLELELKTKREAEAREKAKAKKHG